MIIQVFDQKTLNKSKLGCQPLIVKGAAGLARQGLMKLNLGVWRMDIVK